MITQPQIYKKGRGEERWIANTKKYCGKILLLNKDKRCSVHYHKLKDEPFSILSGKIQLDYYKEYPKKESFILKPGDTIHIPIGVAHRFIGIADKSEILEVSTEHFEEDSYRLEPGDSQK